MSNNGAEGRVAALEAELARIQSERAHLDARIRTGQLDVPVSSTRRADVLGWGAFVVAAALVSTLIVTIAQRPTIVHERTRVETVVVPQVTEVVPEVVPDAAPTVTGTHVQVPNRVRPPRTTTPTRPDLLGEDRCGNDPTCGI